MENPITASFRWSIQEVLLLNQLHMRHAPKFRNLIRGLRLMGFMFGFIGGLFLLAGFLPNSAGRSQMLVIAIGFILFGCALLFGYPALVRRAVVKSYAQKPDRDMVIDYELSDSGIKTRSDIASTDLQWRGIRSVVRTVDGFLLYVTELQLHWLPMHSFKNKEDFERLTQLARAKTTYSEG